MRTGMTTDLASETRPDPTQTGVDWRARFAALRLRIGNPLRWDDIDKVLVILVLQFPIIVAFFARSAQLLRDPTIEPYMNRRVLPVAASILGAFVTFLVVASVVGLSLRHRERGRRRYLMTVIVVWWVTAAFGVYIHGVATSALMVLVPILSLVSLLLFDVSIATV